MLLALLLAAAPPDYETVKSDLALLRERTALRYAKASSIAKKAVVLAETRGALLTAFDDQLFPAWAGTPWDFYGTTEVPRDGKIACGYFVSTLMLHAGFKVPRVKMAQQASEYIVRSLAEPEETLRLHDLERAAVIDRVRARLGEGLFVVGMDYHVGFLRLTARDAQLCHAAFFEPTAMLCEPAATSQGFSSGYHVIGKLFADVQLRAWLEGKEIALR